MNKGIKRFVMLAALMLAATAPAQAAKRYLVLSDSIFTQTYGSVRSDKLAFTIVNSDIRGATITVLGSPGLTTAPQGGYPGAVDLLPAVEIWKGRFGGNGAYIQVGVNDYGLSVPLETYKTNLRTLVSGLQSMGLGVICIKPMWSITQGNANAEGLTLSAYRQAMVDVCAEYGVGTVTFAATSSDFVDGLHLNEAGHQKFADWFINIGVYFGAWTRVQTAAALKK